MRVFPVFRASKAGMLLLALVLTSCSQGQKENSLQICSQKADLKIEDRLFLGADMQKGRVGSKVFQDFLDKIVTPEFPEGFSIIEAQGQWRGRWVGSQVQDKMGKIEKEPSWVIDLIYSPTKKREESVRNIIKSYKKMFHQEAVLRLHTPICATFL